MAGVIGFLVGFLLGGFFIIITLALLKAASDEGDHDARR